MSKTTNRFAVTSANMPSDWSVERLAVSIANPKEIASGLVMTGRGPGDAGLTADAADGRFA